jgi:hypothetical protein
MMTELDFAISYAILPAGAVMGFIIGYTFADIDLAPPLPMRHRSVWTHSPLFPVLAMLAINLHPLVYWFLLGFLPAYCIHLLRDCFPKCWHGSARVNLYPFQGALNAPASALVMAGGAFYCVWAWWPLAVKLWYGVQL